MLACYGIYIQKEEFKAFGYERFIVVLKFTSFSFFHLWYSCWVYCPRRSSPFGAIH
ncbi:hypothetical protein KHA80_08630 [Anaerobacillus sp. HL2]|nr:hypothetical protein KHA80_08630 [Anaerobacillus sp. HL2]